MIVSSMTETGVKVFGSQTTDSVKLLEIMYLKSQVKAIQSTSLLCRSKNWVTFLYSTS